MELPIHQCRSSLQGFVDPLLTIGTARRVPRVDNTDDRQIAAARKHWTGEPLKHRIISLLSDILYTTTVAIKQLQAFLKHSYNVTSHIISAKTFLPY